MKEDILFKYFILNTDKFTRQFVTEKGNVEFYVVKEKLSKDYVRKHLEGLHTIGVFPVKDGKTKFLCIDIDLLPSIYEKEDFKREDYLPKLNELAENIKARFSLEDIKFYKEDGGGKGLHLWCFFDPPATITQISTTILPILKGISYDKNVFDIEWFPNSENSKSIKLPGGVNLRYGIFGTFEVPLETIETVSPRILSNISNPREAIFTQCKAFRDIKEKADIENHLNHKERVAIASMMLHASSSELEWVENYFFRQLKNYDSELTKKNLKAFSTNYSPLKCKTMQEQGLCKEQCKEIGNAQTPYAFFIRAKNELDLSDKDISIDPQDNLIKRNNAFYERTRNNVLVKISNFIIDIKEIEQFIYENGETEAKTYKGTLITEKGEEYPFSIPAEDFSKDDKLKAKIYSVLRVGYSTFFSTKKIEQIRQCIDKFSEPLTILKTRDFGFNVNRTVYYSPSVRIDKDSIIPNNDVVVEIADNKETSILESFLDFSLDHPKRGEQYWKDFIKKELMGLYKNIFLVISVFSHVFDIFLNHYYALKENNNPYILWLAGPSGAGKSRLSFVIQRLFGKFPQFYSFTSSPGRIEFSGYFFKDAIFVVDDYKPANMSDYTKGLFLQLLQNYADRSGRSRLTKDIDARQTYRIRGNMLITGEDITSQEASNIARTIIIEFFPEDVNYDPQLFNIVQNKSININELTPHIIKWCMNLDAFQVEHDFNEIVSKLRNEVSSFYNSPRIIANYARFITSGLYVIKYIYNENEVKDLTNSFIEFGIQLFKNQGSLVENENVVFRFWNTLSDLLSTNQVRIVASELIDDSYSRVPIIGFIKDTKLYIFHNLAYNSIVKSLDKYSNINISSVMLAKLLIKKNIYVKSLKTYFNGKQVRVYEVNSSSSALLKQLENTWEDQKEAKIKK